jgi:hypothetical protein
MVTFRPSCPGCTHCSSCGGDVCLELDPTALDNAGYPHCDNCLNEVPC